MLLYSDKPHKDIYSVIGCIAGSLKDYVSGKKDITAVHKKINTDFSCFITEIFESLKSQDSRLLVILWAVVQIWRMR